MDDGTSVIRRLGAAVAAMALTVSAGYGQTREWTMHKTEDGRNPDGNEQLMLWLLNRARSDPKAEGEFLAASGDDDIEFANRYFKVNLAKLKAEFAALPAAPPAAFDRRLYEASLAHSQDLVRRDAQDHNGQLERLRRTGFQFSAMGFSVYSFSESAMQAHGALNIDWGVTADGMQSGRGHRTAIMGSASSGASSNVGWSLLADRSTTNQVGPLVFSGAYGTAQTGSRDHFNRFITGTVWDDEDGDGQYDPGEGLGGVRLQPDRGSWHAVTGAAGGYAIPATESGNYAIYLSGGALPSPVIHQVRVGDRSVLLDIEYDPQATVPPPPLAVEIRRGSGGIVLAWSGGFAPWQVQQADSPEGPWTNLGQPVSQPSLPLPVSGRVQFFRVLQAP